MKGDGLNFDQSDVDNEEEFETLRRDLARARKEFFAGKKYNHKCYGSSEFE